MKKLPGKAWFDFRLYGLKWHARIVPANDKDMDRGDTSAYCLYAERRMGFSDALTPEQLRTAFVHELQHAIEEHADVDYEQSVDASVADRLTDQVARGWLYFIRENPAIIAFLRDERPKGV